jgi:hypothetical protein
MQILERGDGRNDGTSTAQSVKLKAIQETVEMLDGFKIN